MMKTLILTMLICIFMLSIGFGQERTGEKKWTIDPATGDTIYTEAVSSLNPKTLHHAAI